MKGSRWFIIGIIAFLLIMFAVEYHLPKKFVWAPTFSHYDVQPFGCALFDSVLSSSLPLGYSLSSKTFYQLEQEDSLHNRGILVVTKDLSFHELDTEALLEMAERGNKIMLVSTSFDKVLEDTLRFSCSYSYFSPIMMKKYASSLAEKDSIYWVGDTAVYSRQLYRFYPILCSSYFRNYNSLPFQRLAEKDLARDMDNVVVDEDTAKVYGNYHPLMAFVRPWGKGEIILVSTPLLFTNYGVLDGDNATYLFRLLSRMKDLPVVRTEVYVEGMGQVQQSPLRYFLSHPPLRWAVYLAMVTILLFMIFTAKRRQRAIPVIHEPENRSLEFTKLIGTLYCQKNDHANLVHKKFTYFAEELRREVQVDVEEVADDQHSFHKIAQKTGMDVEEIGKFIREIRPVIYGGRTLSAEEMKRFIDKMNEIINHI
ncbi:DUF4350 domain-containing protein [Bacteroides sp.]|uniref:DUF4350 domain-containing protein n=1 Tax=Bacteroides sp. TaxID=29523 RepID=UPI0026283BEF|nr:DUF4350 domain-containing protein [Bacteroides sp.]MDD3040264.1 DUF4350 domain-containing protein [Bacteroides sp.]